MRAPVAQATGHVCQEGDLAFEGSLEGLSLLDLVQIMAYSERSGTLVVESGGEEDKLSGTMVFDRGNIIVVSAPSTLSLLDKAAKERSADARLSLRRVHSLASLRELFDIHSGEYRFVETDEPIIGIDGVDVGVFYEQGALDTGDLLLVLAKTMDAEHPSRPSEPAPYPAHLARNDKPSEFPHHREHERWGPVVIRASTVVGDESVSGYLTNLSFGGVFFHGDKQIEVGSELVLSFELPWDLGACEARCTVSWGRSEGPERQRGSGMRFDELEARTEDKLTTYLQRFARMAQSLGA